MAPEPPLPRAQQAADTKPRLLPPPQLGDGKTPSCNARHHRGPQPQVEGRLLPGFPPLGEEVPQPWWDVGCGVPLCPQTLPKRSPGDGSSQPLLVHAVSLQGTPGQAPCGSSCHPRKVPRGLPAPLGASTHALPPDADSALPGELPAARSWGLHRKTSAAP